MLISWLWQKNHPITHPITLNYLIKMLNITRASVILLDLKWQKLSNNPKQMYLFFLYDFFVNIMVVTEEM